MKHNSVRGLGQSPTNYWLTSTGHMTSDAPSSHLGQLAASDVTGTNCLTLIHSFFCPRRSDPWPFIERQSWQLFSTFHSKSYSWKWYNFCFENYDWRRMEHTFSKLLLCPEFVLTEATFHSWLSQVWNEEFIQLYLKTTTNIDPYFAGVTK